MNIETFQRFNRYKNIVRVLIHKNLISQSQFMVNFLFLGIMGILGIFTQVAIVHKFMSNKVIAGWGFNNLLLYLATYELLYSLLGLCIFPSLAQLPNLIHTGRLDIYLVRPLSLIFQFITVSFNFDRLPRLIASIFLAGYFLVIHSGLTFFTFSLYLFGLALSLILL